MRLVVQHYRLVTGLQPVRRVLSPIQIFRRSRAQNFRIPCSKVVCYFLLRSYDLTSLCCFSTMYVLNCSATLLFMYLQALVGDRYGYRPFPAKIPVEEFHLFLELGLLHNVSTVLLSKWYKLDHNAVSTVYQLVPITVHYPNYSSKDQCLRSVDRDGWWETFLKLQATFWSLVKIADRMTKERTHIYFQSGNFI